MVLVGEVTDPESEGTKSGEENARSRLMFLRLETPSGEAIRQELMDKGTCWRLGQ